MEPKKRIRDPKGGLTAYGRKYYKEKFGNKLRPGVKNVDSTKSWIQKKRWASWATRMYTNPKGSFIDKNGNPTRLSLQAKAWGSKPPRNRQEASRLASKGRRILQQYRNYKKSINKKK